MDQYFIHSLTSTRYVRRCKVWFEEHYDCWVAATPELRFIEDAAFQGPYYIAYQYGTGFLAVGCLTVDNIPILTDSTPMDSLNLYM